MVTGLKAAHYTLGLAWFQLMILQGIFSVIELIELQPFLTYPRPSLALAIFIQKSIFCGYFDVTNSLIHSY